MMRYRWAERPGSLIEMSCQSVMTLCVFMLSFACTDHAETSLKAPKTTLMGEMGGATRADQSGPAMTESIADTSMTDISMDPHDLRPPAPEVALTQSKTSALTVTIEPVVAPLLTTTWGQSGSYQTMTPRKDGEPTYPGCTTIASAQILYYYQYQDHAESEVYYTLEHGPLSGQGVTDEGRSLYLPLPDYTYTYDAMASSLDDATPAEIKATATFIFHVGATMNAQFGGGEGSSATGRQIENAFRYQWGFNNIARRQMSIIARDAFGFNDKEWAQVIRDELNAGRPVLYMAQQENGDAGHAFVIDGYSTNGLVHVNFGWGGHANGWYNPNTLEDPSGRRWTRDPLIFRGLEPELGYARARQGAPTLPEHSTSRAHQWNGALSLISYSSETESGYGLTVDEGMVHPPSSASSDSSSLSPVSPLTFVQWEIDQRDGQRLKISAEGAQRATITYGPWNDRAQDRTYRDVTLPFVLDPTLDGRSVDDGQYYVVAIAFDGDLSSSTIVTAEPTQDAAGPKQSHEATPIMIEDMTWNGNGSLISLTSGERTGYGMTTDEAMIHPSSPGRPAVFFQWELDGRDGRRLRLEAEGMGQATLRYGAWDQRDADITHTVTLPYTLDPVADGVSSEDGQYYVIMVSFDHRPEQSTSVIATVVE